MFNTVHPIDHCDMQARIKGKGLSREDFQEVVMERAETLIREDLNPKGRRSSAHELAGVELVARAVATSVIDQGASRLSQDFGVDLEDLKRQAGSQHISSC